MIHVGADSAISTKRYGESHRQRGSREVLEHPRTWSFRLVDGVGE